jgi:uncharacterized membrane protein
VSRDAWLLVHILGVVIFLGNIIITAVWKTLADRTRDAAVIGYAQRLVTVTDIAFTTTGVALIAISGPVLADDLGGVGGPAWITWGLGLFAASGVIWIGVLIPVQILQARLAREFAAAGEIPDRYWKLARIWSVFGTIATLLPLMNLYLMVFKPT